MKEHRLPIFAGVAVVLIVVVWFVAFWHPETSGLAAAQARESQAAGQVATDQGQIIQLRAESKNVKNEEAQYQKLLKGLPVGPSLDQLLRTINTAAAQAKVVVTAEATPIPGGWGASAAAPATPGAATGPASLSLSITVDGSNSSVLKFITTLDDQPRVYVVDDFSLRTAPGAAQAAGSSTGLTVETFYQSAASNNPTYPGN
jgi:Tfp pilus assembly protein PilO